jgi:PilZ domain
MAKPPDRRQRTRFTLGLPVRIQGRDPDGTTWDEIGTTVDASLAGLGLRMRHPTRLGQVLHLSLPLPKRMRQYDLTDPSYRVYALVRHPPTRPDGHVGVLLLGRHPPRGAESLPAETYLLPGDPEPAERRRFARFQVRLAVKLDASRAPGGVAREERTVAEDIGKWGARVRTSLPVVKGDMVGVEEVDGSFKTRAEVRSISIESDGHPRLSLLFLDEPAPEHLLPPKEE